MTLTGDLFHAARETKHRAFLAYKRGRWLLRDVLLAVNDRRWALAEKRRPFTFVPDYYAHTFLARRSPDAGPPRQAPPILWAIWLGPSPTGVRRASLEALKAQPGLDVRVVTDPSDVVMDGHPFHPAFKDLHVVHQSDYLRAYLMHHIGGVYSDVKPYRTELQNSLHTLNQEEETWVIGYREITSEYVPDLPRNLGAHLKRHYRAVMGPSAFVCRPHSVFTAEWMRELHDRLDYFADALAEASSATCDPYAAPAEYPIRWSEILGDITQPLSLKHHNNILLTDDVRPVLKDYR